MPKRYLSQHLVLLKQNPQTHQLLILVFVDLQEILPPQLLLNTLLCLVRVHLYDDLSREQVLLGKTSCLFLNLLIA